MGGWMGGALLVVASIVFVWVVVSLVVRFERWKASRALYKHYRQRADR
jgi:hypothetical protein